jgi:hypothetical protein
LLPVTLPAPPKKVILLIMIMVYQWLTAAIVIIIPAIAGAAILSWLKVLQEKISILVVGTILGISTYGTLAYAVAYVIPLTTASVLIELILFLFIAFVTLLLGGWRNFLHTKIDRTAVIIFCASLVLFSIIGSKLLIERSDGIYTGIINAYGDVGWHGAIISGLAEQGTLPMGNPILAGERLTYPFLANLISSTMIVVGSSLTASVNVPAILLIPCILVLLYLVVKTYSESKTAGTIACILFLFGGATLGWIQFFSDISTITVPLIDFLLALPAEDYSGVGTSLQGFHFLNPVTSLLLPQRAMLFGIPIVLAVLLLIHPKNIGKKHVAIIAGVLAGMLPLFHAHACIALAVAVIAMIIVHPAKRSWISFFIPALLIGLPELLFYTQGSATSGSFFRYGPFWMAESQNHILYWIKNTGIYIPLSIIGLFFKAPKVTKALALAGTLLFVLADTFLFAPWAWDNFKLFVFWLIFILPLVTWLFSVGLTKSSPWILKLGVVLVIVIHMFAGFLDVYKLAIPTARTWQEWDAGGVHIAQAIQKFVPPSAFLLTAPVHNSPAVLAGRTIFLGYPAHIWSHGGVPWDREQAIKNYFAGQGDIIENIEPNYILVGPQERSLVPNLVIRPSWKEVTKYGEYTLYTTN